MPKAVIMPTLVDSFHGNLPHAALAGQSRYLTQSKFATKVLEIPQVDLRFDVKLY